LKPFRFSLQAVMTIRVNQEAKALEAFARAQAELELVLARRLRLHAELESGFAQQRKMFEGAVSAEELQRLQKGLRVLHESIARCETEVRKAQAVVEERTRALLEARQKREVMEKLYEKQLANHQAEVARLEQRMADEFAAMRPAADSVLKWK
jgi:flagellar export protein FliJ